MNPTLNPSLLRTLLELTAQPTAPFREHHVARYARDFLEARRVPHCFDPDGNLLVGVGSLQAYEQLLGKSRENTLWLLVAHMDHPGFHIHSRLSPTRLKAQWFGGGPTQHLVGSTVWLGDSASELGTAKIAQVETKAVRGISTLEIEYHRRIHNRIGTDPRRLYGGLHFRQQLAGDRLYTRVADDLVGVHLILETLAYQQRYCKPGRRQVLGLLTRGEEVGFVGAMQHFARPWLREAGRPVCVVSLETSRNRPGAIPGKGPVVRLGDRRTVFDSGSLEILSILAQKRLPKQHQRQLMDGGVCEATAAMAYGIPAVGVAIPLGNYHNQNFDGGRNAGKVNGPAPEFVQLADVAGAHQLCRSLCAAGAATPDPWTTTRSRLEKNSRRYQRLLVRHPLDKG